MAATAKFIHYCWFGRKPLPKLARKCIRSWQKFLPGWEIIEWNEDNSDFSACAFASEAYAEKHWAFVADYVRVKALHEYGGIYLDTDMEILAGIDDLLEKPVFLGREDGGEGRDWIAAGVLYAAEPKTAFFAEMMRHYEGKSGFDKGITFVNTIPRIITRILDTYSHEQLPGGIDVYGGDVWVYPKDYFYPVSFDWARRFRSGNTRMIHYYDASWTSRSNRLVVWFNRHLPRPLAAVFNGLLKASLAFVGLARRVVSAIEWRLRSVASKHLKRPSRVARLAGEIDGLKTAHLVLSNPEWIGVSRVASEMLGGFASLYSMSNTTRREICECAAVIVASGKSPVLFNGFGFGWDALAREVKRLDPARTVKALYHGSDVRLARQDDYRTFKAFMDLHDIGMLDEIGFVKKSQAEFYIQKGYRARFVMNTISLGPGDDRRPSRSGSPGGEVRIGLYCSGDTEWKNVFNQIAAASLIEGAVLDCVPIDYKMAGYAEMLGMNVSGSMHLLGREELLARMARNDVNLFASYAEAAPLSPLESLELGVPCITSNNHHYWLGTKLRDLLVVCEPDNIYAIRERILDVLGRRAEVMGMYAEWKAGYDAEARRSVDEFVKGA